MATIDFETFSMLNVVQVGSALYARHPSTEVLVMSYMLPGWTKPKRWVPSGVREGLKVFRDEPFPDDLREYIEDTDGYIEAHNVNFEKDIWEHVVVPKYDGPPVDRARWRCSAAKAAAAAYPRSLAMAGVAAKLRIQKDSEGTRLIQKFCAPKKPTKGNPRRIRIQPWDDIEDFEKLCNYCDTDVMSEHELSQGLPDLSPLEWHMFLLDMEMNDRGLPLDMKSVRNGIRVLTELERRNKARVEALTGGVRASQRDKFLEFLQQSGIDVENLQAKTLKDFMAARGDDLDPEAKELLQLRLEGGKASTKKLKKMLQVVCDDGFVRGCFLYNGAVPTRRWCIAKGELLHVEGRGLVRIEHVQPGDRVWDGEAWVGCDGIVPCGMQDTMVAHGVHATKEHIVWQTPNSKMHLGAAPSVMKSLPESFSSMRFYFQAARYISGSALILLKDSISICAKLAGKVATRCTARFESTASRSFASLKSSTRRTMPSFTKSK